MSRIIPTIVPIVEDEDFTSWISYLAKINLMTYSDFCMFFFNTGKMEKGTREIDNLVAICKMYEDQGFPSLKKVLFNHSDCLTSGLFQYPLQLGEKMEALMYGMSKYTSQRTLSRKVHYCPVCAENDRKKYGRIILHVPHMIKHVEACYKHGVRLVKEDNLKADPIQGSDDQVRFAKVMKYLHNQKCVGNIEDIKKYVSLYLPEIIGIPKSINRDTAFKIIKVLDEETLKKIYYKNCFQKQIKKESKCNGFTIKKKKYPFVYVECNACGNVLLSHYDYVSTGLGCHVCVSTLNQEQYYRRLIEIRTNKMYEMVSLLDKEKTIRMLHKRCGHIFQATCTHNVLFAMEHNCPYCLLLGDSIQLVDLPDDLTMDEIRSNLIGKKRKMECGLYATIIDFKKFNNITVKFENGFICEKIYYKHFYSRQVKPTEKQFAHGNTSKGRVGEKRIMNCGLQATIIAYNTSKDIDVQFEDGKIRKHIGYSNFLEGQVSPNKRDVHNLKDERLGERMKMNCGLFATIIHYKTCQDIDVQFEDGSIRRHANYDRFRKGAITPPKKNAQNMKDERLGERIKMNCGLYATIINYRKYKDIDIQFEDGSIRKHVSYGRFQKGTIWPDLKSSRIGLKKKMNCGINATIIHYKTCQDVDVQFEDGSIRKHVKFDSFIKGKVRPR